jgi:hypothetical protein
VPKYPYEHGHPFVTIRLHGPGHQDDDSLQITALLDTGADRCLLDEQFAREFGLRKREARRSSSGRGIGGAITEWEWPRVRFEMEFLGVRFSVEPGFTDLGPPPGHEELGSMPNLLGRDDFLRRFVAAFHPPDPTANPTDRVARSGYVDLEPFVPGRPRAMSVRSSPSRQIASG